MYNEAQFEAQFEFEFEFRPCRKSTRAAAVGRFRRPQARLRASLGIGLAPPGDKTGVKN